ncbi:hypothetical protein [Massilia cavernae]|uniref:Transporter n=1 Tax=Massilia cavernae TaxID=2320864 RepID=A0A418XRN8_9BURK|nr:hypothetical protein [Massilia cavernae]RJG15209.1 hypothetical protein D3872_13840 [Massilia cavernae]
MRAVQWKALAPLLLAALAGSAAATEDTGTPGNGMWEINVGIGGQRSSGMWELTAPETDFNYGWGENAQLVLGLQRVQLRERGQDPVRGWGSATAGVKWRFADQDKSGIDLALFPAFSWNPSSSAERRGLVEPGRSLVLPLVVGFRRGGTGWYAEAGRNLIEDGDDEWLAGFKVTHACLPSVECRVELQHSVVRRQFGHTEASAGFKWSLSGNLILQASAGRDLHPHDATQNQVVVYIGIQLLR